MEAAMYIEHVWNQIEEKMRVKGFQERELNNMKITFAGGLHAASAAIVQYKATLDDIGAAIDWIDGQVP